MQITVIAVGKIREKYLRDGIAEYEKRLGPLVKLKIIELADEKRPAHCSPAQCEAAKAAEGNRITAAIPPEAYAIALDAGGERWSSGELARAIDRWEIAGRNSLAFVIGGDLGLSGEVLAKCPLRLSLSPMTFTHPMARMILLEQVYRAVKINRGEPYHK
ncbi:MAG TPA: 23S rRNA (pseudouridine(1915)-N(3))-methyltransferase RlmH [Methanoregula sp.]|nr:23S rRNA (pseudouridine(1915)-N(3))-methyltransferase RlmH [Methanoregula sp.]